VSKLSAKVFLKVNYSFKGIVHPKIIAFDGTHWLPLYFVFCGSQWVPSSTVWFAVFFKIQQQKWTPGLLTRPVCVGPQRVSGSELESGSLLFYTLWETGTQTKAGRRRSRAKHDM